MTVVLGALMMLGAYRMLRRSAELQRRAIAEMESSRIPVVEVTSKFAVLTGLRAARARLDGTRVLLEFERPNAPVAVEVAGPLLAGGDVHGLAGRELVSVRQWESGGVRFEFYGDDTTILLSGTRSRFVAPAALDAAG